MFNGQLISLIVVDLNSDDRLDIMLFGYNSFVEYVLFGYGDGNFHRQTIFLTEDPGSDVWVAVGYFNGDNCDDIVAMNSDNHFMDLLLSNCECFADKFLDANTFIH